MTLRTAVADTLADRARRRRLVAELESYTSPAERAELDAILTRASDEARAELSAATRGRFAA